MYLATLANLGLHLRPLLPGSQVDTAVLVATVLALVLGNAGSHARLAVEDYMRIKRGFGETQKLLELLGGLAQGKRLGSQRHVDGTRDEAGGVLRGLSHVHEDGIFGGRSGD